MIIEYIRYDVPSDRGSEFEAAWQRASTALDALSHCLDHDQIQELRHYERTAIASGEAPRRAGAIYGEEYRLPEAQAALSALSSGAANGR